MTELAEHAQDAVTTGAGETCDAIWEFLGIERPCGQPAIGQFRRICLHEHVRTGGLCRDHAEAAERGMCGDCWELPGDLAHECPIATERVTPGGAR